MTHDQLVYFKGWRDSCENTATLMENIAANAPEQFLEFFSNLASTIRLNGQHAIGLAESFTETKQ